MATLLPKVSDTLTTGGWVVLTPGVTAFEARITNISTSTRFFSYLGWHGKTLTSGQSQDLPGGLLPLFTNARGRVDARRYSAFKRHVLAGYIQVEYTPAPLVYDPVAEATKQLGITTGSPAYVTPYAGQYSGPN